MKGKLGGGGKGRIEGNIIFKWDHPTMELVTGRSVRNFTLQNNLFYKEGKESEN